MIPLSLFQEAAAEAAEAAAPAVQGHGASNRTLILGLMVALPVICTIMAVVGGFRLKAILERIKRINGRSELEVLRKEAKLQGTMAMLLKPFLGIANLLFVVDLFVLNGPVTDLVYSVVPSLVSIAVSLPFRKYESQIKDLPCATEDLRKEWLEIRQG